MKEQAVVIVAIVTVCRCDIQRLLKMSEIPEKQRKME